MTAASGTSSRALRAARRREVLRLHEQQHEKLVGREEIAAPVEAAAANASEAGTETAWVAKPTADGAPTGGAEAKTGAAEAATLATASSGFEAETEWAAGTATASGGDSASHAAAFQAVVLRIVGRGPAVEREQTPEAVLPAPRAPTGAETAAVAGEDASPAEGGMEAGVQSAETPTATVGADTLGHGLGAGGTFGRETGAAAHVARGRGGRNFRAQPAPRRPGEGLGPGATGPLLGWLLQG
ncbi:unnamed protein product [Closterium sp. Naga37s-1]|nr:unnamed protein product [Closterium sp. Naga37s-1]